MDVVWLNVEKKSYQRIQKERNTFIKNSIGHAELSSSRKPFQENENVRRCRGEDWGHCTVVMNVNVHSGYVALHLICITRNQQWSIACSWSVDRCFFSPRWINFYGLFFSVTFVQLKCESCRGIYFNACSSKSKAVQWPLSEKQRVSNRFLVRIRRRYYFGVVFWIAAML